MRRVLLYTPMYRVLGECVASWATAIRAAQRLNASLDMWHLQDYSDPVADSPYDAVLAKYTHARNVFLAGDWDVLITLEDDMLIPLDGIPRLLNVLRDGADIAYGLYVLREMLHWNVTTHLEEMGGTFVTKHDDAAQGAFNQVIDCVGVGLGFTALTRHAVQAIPFRRGGIAANDWYMALDAKAAGLVQRADCGLICGHFSLTPSPRILYPVGIAPFYRVQFMDMESS